MKVYFIVSGKVLGSLTHLKIWWYKLQIPHLSVAMVNCNYIRIHWVSQEQRNFKSGGKRQNKCNWIKSLL